MKVIKTKSAKQFNSEIRRLLADNFTIQQQSDVFALLSRKKKFNWVVAIICLFIPIIGWIALVSMIIAAGRGSSVVEVQLQSA